MRLIHDADLRGLNALRVSARSRALARIDHWYEVEDLAGLDEWQELPVLVLGGGSNVLFRSDFPGLIVAIHSHGIQILEENDESVLLRVAAGESWHRVVHWAVEMGLWGIENLALIPGLAGAAPIQNIGAYGVELSSCLESVTAWDRISHNWTTLSADRCRFGYRSSRFRDDEPDRFVITEIALRLARHGRAVTDYPGVAEAVRDCGLESPQPAQMAAIIERIRRSKLPDPGRLGNAGSFFKNPILHRDQAEALLLRYPELPQFPVEGGRVKLGAAWMIERCGWKGHRDKDAGIYPKHALVLVNYGSASGQQLWSLARRIQESVHERFGVILEPEPVII